MYPLLCLTSLTQRMSLRFMCQYFIIFPCCVAFHSMSILLVIYPFSVDGHLHCSKFFLLWLKLLWLFLYKRTVRKKHFYGNWIVDCGVMEDRSHPPSPYPHAQMAHLSLEGLRPGQPRCPVTLLMGQKGLRKGRQGFTEDSHEWQSFDIQASDCEKLGKKKAKSQSCWVLSLHAGEQRGFIFCTNSRQLTVVVEEYSGTSSGFSEEKCRIQWLMPSMGRGGRVGASCEVFV